jgi:hypothetical protein
MCGCRRLVTRCKPGLQPPDVVVAASKVWMHAYSASPSFLARQLTIWSGVNIHEKSRVCFEGCVADSRCQMYIERSSQLHTVQLVHLLLGPRWSCELSGTPHTAT